MRQENETRNDFSIKSEVWTDEAGASTIAITEGARVAACFNDCGQVVICQEETGGDDAVICFEHEHIDALIRRLQAIAADEPRAYYSDTYREALRLYGGL